MATVSNPAKLSSIVSVYPGSNSLAAHVRGGSIVPMSASSAISTTVAGLEISQFNGVSSYTNVSASISPTSLTSQTDGTSYNQVIGSAIISASGGTGSYTYGTPTLASGSSGNGNWSISVATGGTSTVTAQASASSTPADLTVITGVWNIVVSDGTSSVTVSLTVTWN